MNSLRPTVLVLCVAAFASAQDVPSTLDEMLAIGLKSNPDVLLAEAKVRQAEAEMMQARLKVTREIVELWNQRRKKEMLVQEFRAHAKESEALAAKGAVPASEASKSARALQQASAELAEFNFAIRPLLGIGLAQGTSAQAAPGSGGPARLERPEWPSEEEDPLAKAVLDVDFADAQVIDAVRTIFASAKLPGNLVIDRNLKDELGDLQVTLALKGVTVRAAIEATADCAPIALLRKSYGYLLTSPSRAETISAPALPTTIPLYE